MKMSIRFATLEKLSDNEDISRAWENIKEQVKKKKTKLLLNYDKRLACHNVDDGFSSEKDTLNWQLQFTKSYCHAT
jgi:hypothetical protein